MSTLGTCEHCQKTVREEDYDAHLDQHHPFWSIEIAKHLDRIASALESIVSAGVRGQHQDAENGHIEIVVKELL